MSKQKFLSVLIGLITIIILFGCETPTQPDNTIVTETVTTTCKQYPEDFQSMTFSSRLILNEDSSYLFEVYYDDIKIRSTGQYLINDLDLYLYPYSSINDTIVYMYQSLDKFDKIYVGNTVYENSCSNL